MANKNEAQELDLETGSGNVFSDLGLEDAPELKLKAAIAGQINAILAEQRLSQAQSASLLGLPQPKISALKNGKLHGFSLEKLLSLMLRLGHDVEIVLAKSNEKRDGRFFVKNGRKTVSVAA